MKKTLVFDLVHPADYFVFKNVIKNLKKNYRVVLVAREKDILVNLIKSLKTKYYISTRLKPGYLNFFLELVKHNLIILKIAKENKADAVISFGGWGTVLTSLLTRIKTISFYDTDHAKIINFLEKLNTRYFHPYNSLINPDPKFKGTKEVSYLHPNYFKANKKNVKKEFRNKSYFFIRLVSWEASHDKKASGISKENLNAVIEYLSEKGRILISSEKELPKEYQKYSFNDSKDRLHHYLAHAKLCISEGSTTAAEAALLGTPTIYINNLNLNYIDELKILNMISQTNNKNILNTVSKLTKSSKKAYKIKAEQYFKNHADICEYITKKIISLV